jgi:hypothetical protein
VRLDAAATSAFRLTSLLVGLTRASTAISLSPLTRKPSRAGAATRARSVRVVGGSGCSLRCAHGEVGRDLVIGARATRHVRVRPAGRLSSALAERLSLCFAASAHAVLGDLPRWRGASTTKPSPLAFALVVNQVISTLSQRVVSVADQMVRTTRRSLLRACRMSSKASLTSSRGRVSGAPGYDLARAA